MGYIGAISIHSWSLHVARLVRGRGRGRNHGCRRLRVSRREWLFIFFSARFPHGNTPVHFIFGGHNLRVAYSPSIGIAQSFVNLTIANRTAGGNAQFIDAFSILRQSPQPVFLPAQWPRESPITHTWALTLGCGLPNLPATAHA